VASKVVNNVQIIDAPAGNGKTYHIREQLHNFLIEHPNSSALAITYTNRAADEIKSKVDSTRVHISTIHAFISHLISPFFKQDEVIDLYFDKYGEKIRTMLTSKKKKDINRNEKYIKHYGEISLDVIKKNIHKDGINYGESSFSAYYYGRLSHDDLLEFTSYVVERFPKLYLKINRQFKLVVIDEYQDTAQCMLDLFFEATSKNKNMKLCLYGDTTQQIYQTYDKNMQDKLKSFGVKHGKLNNYRSNDTITNILNNIDGRQSRRQIVPQDSSIGRSDFLPMVICMDQINIDSYVSKKIETNPNTLALYVFNRERFKNIGAGDLFSAYKQIFDYMNPISVKDVLTELDPSENPDTLMKVLLSIQRGASFWKNKRYGELITFVSNQSNIFSRQMILQTNKDKKRVNEIWKRAYILLQERALTIESFIDKITEYGIIRNSVTEDILQSEEYRNSGVFNVCISEFMNLINKANNVSTQHGVKGESHDAVVFVAEDSTSYFPFINMYDFFELWSNLNFSIDDFESFAISYKNEIKLLNDKVQSIKDTNELQIIIKEIQNLFEDNVYYKMLLKEIYDDYFSRSKRAGSVFLKLDKIIKSVNKIERIMVAYKIFYVGCSRAKRNLTVILDKEKIEGFEDKLKQKLELVGFKVVDASKSQIT
jgi:DNA helicase-2/ATP-dependent DNA helicase PcrA